ncbi:hypothetical protein A2U01_0107302, partial [Trifolium medium]|nr:hypothetical protein [Trifolium medium]
MRKHKKSIMWKLGEFKPPIGCGDDMDKNEIG